MNPKTKTKIRVAVKDYFSMFPEDWELCKLDIDIQRQNLKNEFASLEGVENIKRALFAVPEKLSSMISLKLTPEELHLFTQKEHARWFALEFPQFRITQEV